MNWLAENALPIWVGGAIALTLAAIVYFQTRTNGALWGMAGVVCITAVLLLVNRLIETPREAVERTLYELAATVEANDVQGALKFLAPSVSAELKKDVETLMPTVRIDRARIVNTPETIVSPNGDSATVKCQGIVVVIDKRSGMKQPGGDHVVLQWTRSGDRWLLADLQSQEDWAKAVGKVRSSKVPALPK